MEERTYFDPRRVLELGTELSGYRSNNTRGGNRIPTNARDKG